MFDFMKDMYLVINGFDMEQVQKEKKEMHEREKNDIIIFSKNTKKIIIAFFFIYFVLCGVSIYIGFAESNISNIIRNTFLLVCTLITIISFMVKGKKAEITGLLFMIITISFTFVLPAYY